MHNLIEIPHGKRVQDVLPQWANVIKESPPIGMACPLCASCSKPFTAVRKPRLKIRLYLTQSIVPVAFQFRICGQCRRLHRAGGDARNAMLAGIERFIDGQEVSA